MNIPPCANFLEKACPQSETYVARERDDSFIIKCKTCGGINVFPKDKNESRGKYEAFLSKNARLNEARQFIESRPIYSFTSEGRKS